MQLQEKFKPTQNYIEDWSNENGVKIGQKNNSLLESIGGNTKILEKLDTDFQEIGITFEHQLKTWQETKLNDRPIGYRVFSAYISWELNIHDATEKLRIFRLAFKRKPKTITALKEALLTLSSKEQLKFVKTYEAEWFKSNDYEHIQKPSLIKNAVKIYLPHKMSFYEELASQQKKQKGYVDFLIALRDIYKEKITEDGYYIDLHKYYTSTWVRTDLYTRFLQLSALAEKWEKTTEDLLNDLAKYKPLKERSEVQKFLETGYLDEDNKQDTQELEELLYRELNPKKDPNLMTFEELEKLSSKELGKLKKNRLQQFEKYLHDKKYLPPIIHTPIRYFDNIFIDTDILQKMKQYATKTEGIGTPKIFTNLIKDYFHMQKRMHFPYETFENADLENENMKLVDAPIKDYLPNQKMLYNQITKQTGGIHMFWHNYGTLATIYYKDRKTGTYLNPPKGLDEEQHIFINAFRRFYASYNDEETAIHLLSYLWRQFSKQTEWQEKWKITLLEFQPRNKKISYVSITGELPNSIILVFITYMLHMVGEDLYFEPEDIENCDYWWRQSLRDYYNYEKEQQVINFNDYIRKTYF